MGNRFKTLKETTIEVTRYEEVLKMRKVITLLMVITLVFGGWLYAQEADKDAEPDKDKKDKRPALETQIEELIEQLEEAESKIKQTIDALIKMGMPAKPLLEKAIQSNSNPKIKKHLEMVLDSYVWAALAECPLEPRQNHTAIWIPPARGQKGEMIIWGGRGEKEYANGARYNPDTDKWTLLPKSPLEARQNHTAIWTGKEMIIWGGGSGTDKKYNDGARYNPKKDKWSMLPRCPVEGRDGHVAIWTGYEMIIWGGVSIRNKENNYPILGASYNPSKNRWYKLPKSPIKGRVHAAAVWADKQIIIWGGQANDEYFIDGAILDPVKRNWEKMREGPFKLDDDSKQPNYPPAAVWNDKRMIIWGIKAQKDGRTSDTVSYSLSSDTWELCIESPILDKTYSTAIWIPPASGLPSIDGEMIICAGRVARYDPTMDQWSLLPRGRLDGVSGHGMVWTDTPAEGGTGEIIIWGGAKFGTPLAEGVRHQISE